MKELRQLTPAERFKAVSAVILTVSGLALVDVGIDAVIDACFPPEAPTEILYGAPVVSERE